jgi:hypothetical protein
MKTARVVDNTQIIMADTTNSVTVQVVIVQSACGKKVK